ncbi:hook-length control protein FliK [Variovorax sp. OK605]|uniref:flagellar hook-length control protein FliK n=1 Tax=Variovorax sp. OK605 TaxID=1855317 RepID=UPI0008EA54C1|nr:flagellar hook-length control protein FliK [Variovorax sp. OK605]SFQ20185.1 hook-length control protein FliK [Variovorax sp. OK605]
MTALAGLIDALLAARLAPRLDVLGIKGEAAIGAPGPAVPVARVENDVRLPSNAALDRQIPGALLGGTAHLGGGAPASVATRLSVAARVIGAVLADLQAEPGPVRGASPLMASRQQPANAAALAGALASTVADSGLFYESHLAEFAAGGRSLAQMALEPQARWAGPVVAKPVVTTANPSGTANAAVAAAVPGAADAPQAAAAVATAVVSQGDATLAAMPDTSAFTGNTSQGGAPANASATQAAPANTGAPHGAAPAAEPAAPAAAVEASRLQAAYRQGEGVPAGSTFDSASPAHRAGEAARQSDISAVAQAARGNEVIHPQAVTLVHQQLDLLAGAVFRWSGQAWPDVPMTWSIQAEQEQAKSDAREGAGADEEGARRWSTTVSLQLPRLGEVDLRVSVAGPSVQAHLSARETATMARLRGDAGQLARRFEAAGLQLQQLQVTAKAGTEAVAQAEAA